MTQSIADDQSPTTVMAPQQPLFRHAKRPEWGVAILVREDEDARSYQFEDGSVRKIRKGYYKLLEPVSDLGDRADSIGERLRQAASANGDTPEREFVEGVAPFSAQVALFTQLYPEGFADPQWIEDHRRTDRSPLKRHRSPISEEAATSLSSARFEEVRAAGGHEAFVEVIADILSRTDLVPISHAKGLRGLDPDEKRRYVESVASLLHGEGRDGARFRNYFRTLGELFGEKPNWRVATALPALVHPQIETAVRRSAFIRQAGAVAPTRRYSMRARSTAYQNFRGVALEVRDRLKTAGHEPRDLLDVYDFIWTTLRTSALEHLGSDR